MNMMSTNNTNKTNKINKINTRKTDINLNLKKKVPTTTAPRNTIAHTMTRSTFTTSIVLSAAAALMTSIVTLPFAAHAAQVVPGFHCEGMNGDRAVTLDLARIHITHEREDGFIYRESHLEAAPEFSPVVEYILTKKPLVTAAVYEGYTGTVTNQVFAGGGSLTYNLVIGQPEKDGLSKAHLEFITMTHQRGMQKGPEVTLRCGKQ